MRMTGAVTLGVLIIEALLAGAFALGFYWLGGWQWGLLFAGLLLLVIVLPWLGELKIVFDSEGPKGAVKIGWWGRVSFADRKTATHVVIRIIGIPIRRRMDKGKKQKIETQSQMGQAEVPPEFEPAAAEGLAEEHAPEPVGEEKPKEVPRQPAWWRRVDSETIGSFCRVIGSGLGATCELVWEADEIRVSVEDPAENAYADTALEQVVGRRQVGPVDLTVTTGQCNRRVRARYRIGLLRAALAGAQMVIDGRIPHFAKQMKNKQKKREAALAEDQKLIEQIMEQRALCEEDED